MAKSACPLCGSNNLLPVESRDTRVNPRTRETVVVFLQHTHCQNCGSNHETPSQVRLNRQEVASELYRNTYQIETLAANS